MIAFLIDADNLNQSNDIESACAYLEANEGPIEVRRAYGSAGNLDKLSKVLRDWSICPFPNLPLHKNTTDVALAVDAMELACRPSPPSVVVIGSGDADFIPLVARLKNRGIRTICVSERGKMTSDAASAYDTVLYVGQAHANTATPASRKFTLKSIFKASPSLRTAKWCPLIEVAHQLRQAEILAKSEASTKFLKRLFPGRFIFTPHDKPHHVKFCS